MTSPLLAGGRLTINLDALAANWRALRDKALPGKCAAVVKANAYGLGVENVVPRLVAEGCDRFFVALPEEGFAVKKLARNAEVFVLNGIHAQSVGGVFEGGLIPCLSSLEQIDLWSQWNRERGANRPCVISVDTGMNRLGLSVDQALALRTRNMADHRIAPIMVMSHFACADEPGHPLNAKQIESFQRVAAAFHDIDSSLSNSAGVLTGGNFGFDLARPGIAIYGGDAVYGMDRTMQPVVALEGRIAQIRHAKKGETVSYGGTHVLARDSKIAIVSVGYADGYPRGGSGAGVPLRSAVAEGLHGFIGGQKVPLLGRVTMDLTMFDVTDVPEDALADGWIELIGPNVTLDDVAAACGTITYEILTSLGPRYTRRVVDR